MKVAIVHDYLNQYGGAERVLEAFLEIFPEAHLYTLFHDKKRTDGRFVSSVFKTSFLDNPLVWRKHRFFIPFMPLAMGKMKLADSYDLVISATAGYAKGINFLDSNKSFHVSYCHTPIRYAWEFDKYFKNPFFRLCKPAFSALQRWDYKTAQRPDVLVANSGFIAKKIKSYYGRDALVIHPPVWDKRFSHKGDLENQDKRYYLSVGRLLHYKKVDLVVEAFKNLGKNLRVVGTGPELNRLKEYARGFPNIEFLGSISDEDLSGLYMGAKALIVPQVEDFGIVSTEALTLGVPVIAYAAGGSLEIVDDGVTGLFFYNQRASDIISTVRQFERMSFSADIIKKSSEKFSFEAFKGAFLSCLPERLR